MTNYNSALKVINLGDTESSLLLRKPRSPAGQGGSDLASPTGLTHVGGPRWESAHDPAYQAILRWVRQASSAANEAANDVRRSADSFSPHYEPANAGDGDITTIWHTEFVGSSPGYPHEIVLDLGSQRTVEGLLYVPRRATARRGRVKDYEVRVSHDGRSWSRPVAAGSWQDDASYKYAAIPTCRARLCMAPRAQRSKRLAVHERRGGAGRRDKSMTGALGSTPSSISRHPLISDQRRNLPAVFSNFAGSNKTRVQTYTDRVVARRFGWENGDALQNCCFLKFVGSLL